MKYDVKNRAIFTAMMILVFTCIFFICTLHSSEKAVYADEIIRIGTIDGPLNMRKSPKIDDGNIITQIPDGIQVELIKVAEEDRAWYYISYNGKKGYVYAKYVALKEITIKHDATFESYLTEQGFDEGYKKYLRILHSMFPNWVFKADHTNLDWNFVIDKENEYRNNKKINVVPKSSIDEWKSTPIANEGDYDYGWTGASKQAIEYFMDPRNFLTERAIFQFISNKYEPSIHNKAGVEAIVKGSFMDSAFPEVNSGYSRYSDVIMAAANQSGVSPYAIASMILHEQGAKGDSDSISGNVRGYEGIYNFFNVGAYDGANAVLNGLNYAKNQGWNSRVKAIMEGAKWFGRDYVNDNQYTPYLKKFNVMNGQGNVGYHQYMTAVMGANSEGQGEYSAYKSIFNQSLAFFIPVYKNMPGSELFYLNKGDKTLKVNEDWGFLSITSNKS